VGGGGGGFRSNGSLFGTRLAPGGGTRKRDVRSGLADENINLPERGAVMGSLGESGTRGKLNGRKVPGLNNTAGTVRWGRKTEGGSNRALGK